MIWLCLLFIAAEGLDTLSTPENVALDASVAVFSGTPSGLTTDPGSNTTGWASVAFPAVPDHSLFPEFAVVDLNGTYTVMSADMFPAPGGGGFPVDFTIAVAEAGEPWVVVYSVTNYTPPTGSGSASILFTQAVTGRFVRLAVTKVVSGGVFTVALRRLQIFGVPGEQALVHTTTVAPCVASPVPGHLTTAYRIEPVGIADPSPMLNWTMLDVCTTRGQAPTAWRVVVDGAWDSGKVEGGALDLGTPYQGVTALRSGVRYVWRVMLWTSTGDPTLWSPDASFVTGRMKGEEWAGEWIGTGTPAAHRAVYLRTDIPHMTEDSVTRAVAVFVGLGYGELLIDGQKVSDYVLSPGFTQYNVRTQYLTFDVTAQMGNGGGPHALGVILGDGWFALSHDPWVHHFEQKVYVDVPMLRMDILLTFANGSSGIISTKASQWRWSYGPITRAWIGGEDIDMRASLPPDWATVGFNDTLWEAAAAVVGPTERFPGAVLVPQAEEATRVQGGPISPQVVTATDDGRAFVYDFGREFQGWARLQVVGPAGATVMILLCGSRDTLAGCGVGSRVNPLGGPYASYFTLAGGDADGETWEPRFMYASLHRVVVNVSVGVTIRSIVGVNVAMDTPPASTFETSDGTYNFLHDALVRTQANYVLGMPNDPTREKKGWTQDVQNMFPTASFFFTSSRTMYPRWLLDILDNQDKSGRLPEVAPGPVLDDGYNGAFWGGMGVYLPWLMWQEWGDPSLLLPYYPQMRAYVLYMNATGGGDHFQNWGLGDWLSPSALCMHNNTLINTPAFYLYSRIIAMTASMVGNHADAEAFHSLATSISSTYLSAFFDAPSGRVASGEQCFQALSLFLDDFLPAASVPAVQATLRARLAEDKYTLTTGFVTFGMMLDVLMDLDPAAGQSVLLQKNGIGPWSNTAGSSNDLFKESWDGTDAAMPSLGGPLGAWSFRSIAGIRSGGPGYRKVAFGPNVGLGGMTWCNATFASPRGGISMAWSLRPTLGNGTQSGVLRVLVTLPPGTSGTVYVPTLDAGSVTEGGTPACKAVGVTCLGQQRDRAVFGITSGSFAFAASFTQW